MSKHGAPGGETILEGEAGFYHSYTGNNLGILRYSFTADNKTSLDKIVVSIDPKINSYIYRLTLNSDLAEDLKQETLLEVVRSIKQIRQPERFWGWLYRTALGKVQHHYRKQQKEKTTKTASTIDAEGQFLEQIKSLAVKIIGLLMRIFHFCLLPG